jgi:hypothetical protein
MSSDTDAGATCPICGESAERGCVYGADRSLLKWAAGPPSWVSNVETAMGVGDPVGQWRLGAGTYAEGVRCKACQRIILND